MVTYLKTSVNFMKDLLSFWEFMSVELNLLSIVFLRFHTSRLIVLAVKDET